MSELIEKQAVIDALLAKMDTIDDKPEVVLGLAVAAGMIKDMPSALEQEPCDDCISRQAAICLADELKDDLPDDDRLSDMVMSHNEGILEYQTQLSLLPFVQPKQTKSCYKMCDKWQRMGRWKPYDGSWYECSECGAIREAVGYFENFCPNCGAKMASPTGSEGSDKE